MKFKRLLILALAVIMTMGLTTMAYAAQAIDDGTDNSNGIAQKEDNRLDPLTQKQLELKEKAIQAKLNGKAKGKVHEVAKGQYVELEREGEGAIWTVLGEFQNLRHNTIPKPDRNVDNSTIWTADFSRDYFNNLLFNNSPSANSLYNFYIEQSSNRFAVTGEVDGWILAPGNAADYDDNDNNDVWKFIRDTVNGWYEQQKASGKTDAEINEYLSKMDIYDRYDYDNDGNFNEPDGYIDTFQSVHAGEGEEAGAPEWAIWAHSWYAYYNLEGIAGPEFNKLGGTQIGNSNYWVGKYTIQPENGGVGVFAHEFGHDIGLPDLYDTSGGENGTGFWTLMSSGSWLGEGNGDIGSKPNHMGAWEKLRMGWLNYTMVTPDKVSAHRLGPSAFNTKQNQAVIVKLPQKSVKNKLYDHYYIAEYKAYKGYDSTLKTGPYFFGYLNNPLLENKVDQFPYQDGLLINYWDTSQTNNQTRRHPGQGLVLPIDAHYTALKRVDGAIWRNRIQTYDSTFSLYPTTGISNLHVNSVASPVDSLPAVSVFDDRNTYYDPANPMGSVINPNTGTIIRIVQQNTGDQPPFMEIQVRPAK